MKKTAEQIAVENYLGKGGLACPYPDCDGESPYVESDITEPAAGHATQKCSCLKCNRSWYDVYTLTGAELCGPLTETGKEG